MSKFKVLAAMIVIGVFGVAACSGGSSDNDDSTVTTVRQKNAALPTVTTIRPLGPTKTTIALRPTTTVKAP